MVCGRRKRAAAAVAMERRLRYPKRNAGAGCCLLACFYQKLQRGRAAAQELARLHREALGLAVTAEAEAEADQT